MSDDIRGRIFMLLIYIPAFVAGLTVHEFAHAWAGNRLGDDTARSQGRLTLDPLAHLDPFGCILIVFAVLSGFPLIGFAKPVPFNPRNLSHPRRDSILIALAGPISNLVQVPVWLLMLWLFRLAAERVAPDFAGATAGGLFGEPDIGNLYAVVGMVLATGIVVNIGLAAFNMIPVPPLDGHWVLEGLGPPFITDIFNAIRPWSFLVLYGLLWLGVIHAVLGPVQLLAYRVVFFALGAPGFF